VPMLAWWMLAAGIGATLAVNILAGIPGGWLAAVIASWPALAFVGCYELLMTLVRAAARRIPAAPSPALEPQVSEFPSPVPSSAESAAEASLRVTLAAGNPWSVNQLCTQFSLTRAQAAKVRERVMAEVVIERVPEPVMNGTGPDA
jgi:hypothetical protein